MAEPRKPTGRYITWMRSMGFVWSRRLRVWVCGAAKYNRDGTIRRVSKA